MPMSVSVSLKLWTLTTITRKKCLLARGCGIVVCSRLLFLSNPLKQQHETYWTRARQAFLFLISVSCVLRTVSWILTGWLHLRRATLLSYIAWPRFSEITVCASVTLFPLRTRSVQKQQHDTGSWGGLLMLTGSGPSRFAQPPPNLIAL